jgi:hypothetical protein
MRHRKGLQTTNFTGGHMNEDFIFPAPSGLKVIG